MLAFREAKEDRDRSELYSLTSDGLKLVHFPRNPALDELYDLKADPRESRNLISSEPKEAAALLARLRERDAIDSYLPEPSTLSDRERENLGALGYLESDAERRER